MRAFTKVNLAPSSPYLSVLRNKIRYGSEPDNPSLITLWLIQENEFISTDISLEENWQRHESQFRLLLETVVDELVPSHWRCLCLDYIYKPLSSLQRLSTTDSTSKKFHSLMHELSQSSQYVSASLSA